MKRVYLSLGSNLGNRAENISKALAAMGSEGVHVTRVSSLYKTQPVDYRPQPWFLNCVLETETELMPLQLLRRCQAIERALGRRPGVAKGPRLIDIDILLYENLVIRSAALTVPHERMAQRRFVLIPLRELAPGLRHPVTQRTAAEMLEGIEDASPVIRLTKESVYTHN